MLHNFKLTAAATALAALIAGSAGGSAVAAPIVFFGEDLHNSSSTRLGSTPNADAASAAFQSRLSGAGTEDFESFSSGNVSSLSLSFPGSTGAITASLTNPSGADIEIGNEPTGTDGNGRYPISGDQYLDVDGANFLITFSSGIAAFGFFGVDIGDFGGALSLTLTNGIVETIDIGNTLGSGGSTDGSVLFFGVITETPFTQVSFSNSDTADIFAFDNMTIGDIGQVVPDTPEVSEPASMALLSFGLLGIAFARRAARKGAQRNVA